MSPTVRRHLFRVLLGLAALAIPACIFWDRLSWQAAAVRHEPLILEAAGRAGVEPALLRAIVSFESDFDTRKIQDGAYGLMQIGRGTGMEWAAAHGIESFMPTDLFDPRTNLHAGAWYLARAFRPWRECDDPVVFALAEYIAGHDAVRAWAGGSKRAADLQMAMRDAPEARFVAGVLARYRP